MTFRRFSPISTPVFETHTSLVTKSRVKMLVMSPIGFMDSNWFVIETVDGWELALRWPFFNLCHWRYHAEGDGKSLPLNEWVAMYIYRPTETPVIQLESTNFTKINVFIFMPGGWRSHQRSIQFLIHVMITQVGSWIGLGFPQKLVSC